MAITTQRVNIKDVVPDPNNPRETFEGLEALIAQFDLNTERPGEPYNLPLLVKDANAYRIVDGERRYQAMQKRGTESFLANVADSFDDAETMMAMLATDSEQPLTEIEKAKGVQRMLELGVPVTRIDKAASLKRGTASKVKKAYSTAKDTAQTLSIEHWLAIAEFEGDEEAQATLEQCTEGEWRMTVNRLRNAREAEKKKAALLEASERTGVEILPKRPRGAELVKEFYSFDVGELEQLVDGKGSDYVMAKPTGAYAYNEINLYRKPSAVSDEEAAAIESDNSIKSAMTKDKRRRAQWVATLFAETGMKGLRRTGKAFERHAINDQYKIGGFVKKAGEGALVPVHASEWMVALLWEEVDNMTQTELLAIAKGKTNETHLSADGLARVGKRFADFLDALIADGYEPSDSEKSLNEKCRSLQNDQIKLDEAA